MPSGADKGDSSGDADRDGASDWAVSTTERWSNEVTQAWKRQQRCERMARLRAQKKQELAQLHAKRIRLELQVQQYLSHLHSAATSSESGAIYDALSQRVLESEALRSQNVALYRRVREYKRLQSLMLHASLCLVPEQKQNQNGMHEEIKGSQCEAHPLWPYRRPSGWRVDFPNGEPSFYFHPFTREEFDAIVKHSHDTFATDPPQVGEVGELFGWKVHFASVARAPMTNALVTRARYRRRVRCSLDEVDAIIRSLDPNTWPLLATPKSWRPHQRRSVSSQTLQTFERDAFVLDGKRVVSFVTVIADSVANARSRAAEPIQHNVQWVTEGGTNTTLVEVAEDTIQVVYDHWANCQSEAHAWAHFLDGAQTVVRFEQNVSPRRLLAA